MFPLHDSIAPRTIPFVTYGIIALCAIAFIIQSLADPNDNRIVEQYGMIPARVLANTAGQSELAIQSRVIIQTPFGPQESYQTRPMPRAPISDWLTLVTCMFLHGSLMHFAGNMWFLHIFGDNVEDRLGHIGYALMYLGTGVLAAATHLFTNPNSIVPTIGASGAIAGVMGAYILLYPKSMVETFIPLPFFFTSTPLPAPLFLGIWFVMQLVNGAGSNASGAGVAWWAHIGGFVAGFAVGGVMSALQFTSPPSRNSRAGLLGQRSYHG
jgi:membrane associated rhomboid family serine protease